jgi:diacylglycerol kinase (ATP)
LISALHNSWAGIRHAARHEAAIRQELVGLVILTPVSILLPVSALEHLILILSLLLVLLVEFLNSAIETTVDRISLEHHPLAGRAKDLGSAAVLIAVVMWGVSWLIITGPLVVRLFNA